MAAAEAPGATADALSYIDKDYDDPQMKQVVHSLIEEEMAAFDPPDYLADKPAPTTRFQSPLLKSEWARVQAEKPMEPMDTSRYDLQPPQGAAAEDEGAWKRAVDNVRAQTEHQHNRCVRVVAWWEDAGQCLFKRLTLEVKCLLPWCAGTVCFTEHRVVSGVRNFASSPCRCLCPGARMQTHPREHFDSTPPWHSDVPTRAASNYRRGHFSF